MSYTMSIGLVLQGSDTGLNLSAQLVDTVGANVGGAVSTGFVEIGNGLYLWTYAGFPDGFRGGVKFSDSGIIKTFVAVNPSDNEYLDTKVSSRQSLGTGTVSYTHSVTVSGNPVDNAMVWVTTNSSDPTTGIVASGLTNTSGQVTFLLDPGTYYVWVQRGGSNFPGPTTITVV